MDFLQSNHPRRGGTKRNLRESSEIDPISSASKGVRFPAFPAPRKKERRMRKNWRYRKKTEEKRRGNEKRQQPGNKKTFGEACPSE